MSKKLYEYIGQTPPVEFIAGVPCRDLTEDDVRRYPPHVLASIAGSSIFKPVTAGKKAKDKPENDGGES